MRKEGELKDDASSGRHRRRVRLRSDPPVIALLLGDSPVDLMEIVGHVYCDATRVMDRQETKV
jgi:hypothetical protein